MRIGIAFDLAPAARPVDGPDDLYEEFDKPATVEALAGVLARRGHDVVLLGDGREFLTKLLADPPDLVWNLAEGEGVSRSRESRVPAVCEMLGVPHTGSDPLTLAVCLDKSVTKRLVSEVVAVPGGCVVEPGEDEPAVRARVEATAGAGPWIVKPAYEGSSKGIRDASLADTPADAAALAVRVARDYLQPILVEEYIVGEEVTVGLVGNGASVEVIGTLRILPKGDPSRFVYSIEIKRDWEDRVAYETPANLSPEVDARLKDAAVRAFRVLGCRDVARADFRLRKGVPYLLEINPLPGLAPDWSDMIFLTRSVGIDYDSLIGRILDAALLRTGLAP